MDGTIVWIEDCSLVKSTTCYLDLCWSLYLVLLDKSTEGMVVTFAYDTKEDGKTSCERGFRILQMDKRKVSKWTTIWHMDYNVDNYPFWQKDKKGSTLSQL